MIFQEIFLLGLLHLAFDVTLVSCSEFEIVVEPNDSRLYLANGDTQKLTCSSNSGLDLSWNVPDNMAKLPQITQSEKTVNLIFDNFDANEQGGEYSCELKKNGQIRNAFQITVVGVDVSKNTPKFEFNKPLEPLSCDFNFTDPTTTDQKSEPQWYQDDKKISTLKDNRFEESSKGLTISDPKRTDAGVYKAVYNITAGNSSPRNFTCEVILEADPFVLSFEKSKNLIEEDKLELQCKVYGYPPSTVSWFKDGKELNDSRATTSDLEGHKNARLVIEKVNFEDAGDYNCTAYSSELKSSDSKVIVVRVKDKLAALWPFLGIVAEVLVLCFIIFIYEKRRNKQAQQAENDHQENEQPEKRGNVRNRRNQN